MSTILTLDASESAIVREAYPDLNDHASEIFSKVGSGNSRLYTKFEIPSTYWYNLIYKVEFRAFFTPYTIFDGGLGENILIDSISFYDGGNNWDSETITWANMPLNYNTGSVSLEIINPVAGVAAYSEWGSVYNDYRFQDFLRYGVYASNASSAINTAYSNYPPQLRVEFLDSKIHLEATNISPASGARITRTKPFSVTFSSSIKAPTVPYYTMHTPTFSSYRLFYKLQSEDVYQSIAVTGASGDTGTIQVPANTLPSGTVEAYIEVTDSGGTTTSSDTITWDTTDTISTAICVRPSGTLVNGAETTEFTWQHINEGGTLPTKSELQFTQSKDSWGQTVTVTGSGLTYEAQPGSFTSGTWHWRVRTYNADSVAGSWSDAVEFLVVAPPTTPTVLILDASPRPEIQWQTNEQEGYQVQLEGIYDQILFGPGKTWRCPQYLDDGTYTVRVRSQNRYGLWSPWGTATIAVSNEPSSEIELSVQFGHIAELSWTSQGYDFYLVYRDGKPIARLTGEEYIDEYSGGQTEYFIRGCYADSSNFGKSNDVSGTVSAAVTMIKAVPDGQWIELPYSTSMYSSISTTRRRDASRMSLQGRTYPVTELGEFYERSVSFSAAFFLQDDPGLQELLGRTVCVKAPDQDVLMATLDELRSNRSTFYISYDFALSQQYFEEEIDIDTGSILSP